MKKTKHHEIDLEELQKWRSEEEVTFASSTRERKRIVGTLNGNLIVYVANKIIWQGMQSYPAVEAYNNVTEKYIRPVNDFKL